jgi:hypothetical protein
METATQMAREMQMSMQLAMAMQMTTATEKVLEMAKRQTAKLLAKMMETAQALEAQAEELLFPLCKIWP